LVNIEVVGKMNLSKDIYFGNWRENSNFINVIASRGFTFFSKILKDGSIINFIINKSVMLISIYIHDPVNLPKMPNYVEFDINSNCIAAKNVALHVKHSVRN
jgi:hypothetical protein